MHMAMRFFFFKKKIFFFGWHLTFTYTGISNYRCVVSNYYSLRLNNQSYFLGLVVSNYLLS